MEYDRWVCWDIGRNLVFKSVKDYVKDFRFCLVGSYWRIVGRRIIWLDMSFRKFVYFISIVINILGWGEIWGVEIRLGVIMD